MKILQKEKAIELRKKGKSYNEIAKVLNVSKGTIFCWIGRLNWSKDIKKQLVEKSKETSRKRLIHLNNLKKVKFAKIYDSAEKEAAAEFEKLKNNALFITGMGIYWGEGDKNFTNGQVRVSNIDSDLLRTFNVFLEECCKIERKKIKGYLLVYPDLDAKKCLHYWSENIKVDKKNFCKPTIIQGRHKTKKLGHGICTIIVSDKRLKKKVLTWLKLFSKLF